MNFSGYAEDVIDFNWYKHGNDKTFSEEDYKGQWNLVKEEYNELIAELEWGVTDNVRSELADLFVVGSYFVYMMRGDLPHYETLSCDPLEYIIGNIGEAVVQKDYLAVYYWTCTAIHNLGGELILEAKLKSNWSKLPKLSEFCRETGYSDLTEFTEKEAKRIETESKGRYNNIKCSVVVGRDTRLVFRCDGGEGKIVKPCTYKGWEEFIEP